MPRRNSENTDTSLTLTIYKIDPSKVESVMSDLRFQEEFAIGIAHKVIHSWYTERKNKGLSNGKEYVLSNIQDSLIGDTGYTLSIYKTPLASTYVPPIAKYFPENEITGLQGQTPPSIAIFIYNNENCYAVSSGKGYILFESFVDLSFPIDLAKRIMDPKVSNTVERDITGAIYARVQQFRSDQFIESQSIGTVWNAINGFISKDVYESQKFKQIFSPERSKVAVNVGSGVTIKRSINSNKLLDFFRWAEEMINLPLTSEQENAFHQLY